MLDGIVTGIVQEVLKWALQYPAVATVLMLIGTLRLIMKPLMTFLHEFVLATPGTGDDALLDQVEKSKVYTTFMYILDWFTSIKPVPPPAVK